jgi:DNA-directed RNA polymerase specialized sigma24 family protein
MSSTSSGSITNVLDALKAGDRAAAQQLWEAYYKKLVFLAHKRLRSVPRGAADSEDVALSAFHCFCRGVEKGRFPRLDDRDDLWQILVHVTTAKAVDLIKYQSRQKRGGGVAHLGQSPDQRSSGASEAEPAEGVSREPSPDFAAQVAEQFERLLGALKDETLRRVALWKFEGYTNEEIAGKDKLDCSERTVERKLGVIKSLWEKELAS